MFFYVNNFFLF